MEKIIEIFKTISANFNLLLSISGAALALLVSPKLNDYKEVINELNTLKQIDVRQYEKFIQARTNKTDFFPKQGVPGYGIDSLIKRIYTRQIRGDSLRLKKVNRYNFDFEVLPYVANNNSIPVDGTLKDWEAWIKSDTDNSCFKANWKYSDPSQKPGVNLDTFYILRHVLLKKFKYSVDNYKQYTYRFYLEKDTTNVDNDEEYNGRNKPLMTDWYSSLDTLDYEKIKSVDTLFDSEIINPRHLVIEGTFVCDSTISILSTGVNKWLKQSAYWPLLSKSDSLSVSILPASHTVWSDISEKTIDDALGFLINKRNESKSVSLFGISISFIFALLIIPLAYFVTNILLLLHLKYLNNELQFQTEKPTYPWFGLYQFGIAKLFQPIIFLILPTIICISLIVRFGGLVNFYLLLLSIAFTLIVAITGYLLMTENNKLKQIIQTKK